MKCSRLQLPFARVARDWHFQYILFMPVSDELIGRNLARMRGDMSQKELAARMKERGWKWSQATVWAIEKGERPLRLAESEDIKAVLGTLWSLTMEDADTQVVSCNAWMYRANQQLEAAVREYLEAQMNLEVAVKQDGVSPRIAELAAGWLESSPQDVAHEVQLQDEIASEADEKMSEAVGARRGKHPEAP
jgi:transcriptional regulator with XRE-family HTH domain